MKRAEKVSSAQFIKSFSSLSSKFKERSPHMSACLLDRPVQVSPHMDGLSWNAWMNCHGMKPGDCFRVGLLPLPRIHPIGPSIGPAIRYCKLQ